MEPVFEEDSEPRKVIEVTAPHSRPLWQKILFLILLVGVIALVIFGVSKLINRTDNKETSKTTQKSEEKTATGAAKASTERCKPKQDLENPKQGYQACVETGWAQKEIKVSGLEIGLSKKDFSGDFPGNINIAITDRSEELVTTDLSNSSSKFEFGKVNVDGKKSTQLVITRSKDSPLGSFPRAIVTATEKNDRTYVFTLNSTDVDFEADTKLYEDFLGTVEFLENVGDLPWSESRNIVIHQPWPGDSITSPVTISGEALSFEAVVSIRIKDSSGKTLTETSLKSSSGTERSAFSGSVTFDKSKASEGTIEVYNSSAESGSDQDKVTFKVKFN